MERVADHLASTLADYGVQRVYGLMGGGASCLNDAFIKENRIQYICFHHEQGAGHAAIGEAKLTGKLAVVNPTTGCGGTNCMTSLLDAWQDSVPVLFLSGNVRKAHMTSQIGRNSGYHLRKYGVQEHDIISTVSSCCKSARTLLDPKKAGVTLHELISIATTSRKGPVWLDVPADVQSAVAEQWQPPEQKPRGKPVAFKELAWEEQKQWFIAQSKTPLVLVGNGARLAGAEQELKAFIEHYNIPFVTTFLACDIIPYDHPLNMGVIGIKGSRAANFAVQNCGSLLILGCSLNCTHAGYDESLFSPQSYKMIVNCGLFEQGKVKIDHYVHADLKEFLAQ